MEISDIISLVSLFVSVFAGIYTWNTRRKLNKQQLQINEYTLLKNKRMRKKKKKQKYVPTHSKLEIMDGEYAYTIMEKDSLVI